MTTQQQLLDFYSRPAGMTSAGEFVSMFNALPNDVGALVRIVQGLTLHEYAASAYGVTIPERRKHESHIRRDAAKFGIFKGDLRGFWFIAGDLVRDVAALNKMEMLPWDVWGVMPRLDEPLQDDQFAFFDQLAALTGTPDSSFEELRKLYEGDDGLRVPATVFNSVLNRPELL